MDIFLLHDDWGCAEGLKMAFCALNSKISFDFTVSHKQALKILASESPKLFIVQPDFYGFNLEKGKQYIKFVRDTFSGQRMALMLTVGPFKDDTMAFFKKLGITLYIEKLNEPGGLKRNYDLIVNELSTASNNQVSMGRNIEAALSDIPQDYAKLSRLKTLIASSLSLLKSLCNNMARMKEAYDSEHEGNATRRLAADSVNQTEKGLELFEELLVILFNEGAAPKDKALKFEAFYKIQIILATVQIKCLVESGIASVNFDEIYSYAMRAYEDLAGTFNSMREELTLNASKI